MNVPAGGLALLLVARIAPSARHRAPFDRIGQVTGVVAMSAVTFATIEAGGAGVGPPRVLLALLLGVLAAAAFLVTESRIAYPMVPSDLFRSRTVSVAVLIGFSFMVAYYGLPFVMSLYLQQRLGLSALGAGAVFLPMMLVGACLTPFSARVVERMGPRSVIVGGLLTMVAGLLALVLIPASTPTWVLAAVMVLVGLGGPGVSPPVTAVLLNSVPPHRTGTTAGVFNTSRQLGGALAVAVFGALLAPPGGFVHGMRLSFLIAAVVVLFTATAGLLLPTKSP